MLLRVLTSVFLLASGLLQAADLQVKQGTTTIGEGQTFNMGSTQVGVTLRKTFTVKNITNNPITVAPLSWSNNTNNPGQFHGENINLGTLAPGATGSFDLVYEATGPGTVTSNVRLFVGGTANFGFFASATGTSPAQVRVKMGTVNLPHNGAITLPITPFQVNIDRAFTIFNDGGSALNLGTVSWTGNGVSVVGSQPGSVPAGASRNLTLRFSGQTAGSFASAISIPHNAPGTASPYRFTVNWNVSEQAIPVIRVKQGNVTIPAGGTFNYGNVLIGESATKQFRVFNDGDQAFTVGTIAIGGNTNNPGSFHVDGSNLSNIQPGSSGTLNIRYDSDETGVTTSDVELWVNGTRRFEFFVKATGTEPIGPVLRVQLGSNVITHNETINFGNTGSGSDLVRTFTAFNDGDQPLSAVVSLSGNTNDPSQFVVDANNVANVAPGSSKTFKLRFDAGGLGTVTSNVRLFVGGTVKLSYFVKGTVSPPNYSLGASPGTRTINAGQNTSFGVSINRQFGFNSNISFSVTGVPSGVSASFNPQTVGASGGTTLNINTNSSAASGSFPLTIRGVGGGLTRTRQVTLNINSGDFAINPSPGSRTVNPGGSTTYSVSIAPDNGFSSNVSLSAPGLPTGVTASFSPQTVGPTGTSTMTVNTSANVAIRTHSLTIRGTGGGVTRTANVNLRVVDGGPGGAPVINAIAPDIINNGRRTTVTLTGQNFQGATVTVPTIQTDPSIPVTRIFPTASVLGINAAGTQMDVEINATDTRIMDFYNLQVDNGVDIEAIPFRVLPAGPLVDLWTPSRPKRGSVYVLSLVGHNLRNATVSASPGGRVRLFSLDTSNANRIDGLMEVDDSAPLGAMELVVSNNGRQIRLPIQITNSGPSQRMTRNLTTGPDSLVSSVSPGRLAGSADKVPDLFFEEFSLRYPQATEVIRGGIRVGDPDAVSFNPSTMKAFDFSIFITVTINLARYFYQRTLTFDPISGDIGSAVLQGLNRGDIQRLGTFVLSFWLNVDLTIYWRISLTGGGFSFPLFCLSVELGLEIPGFRGELLNFNYCIGGQSINFTSGSTNTIDLDGGPCAQTTPEGPPSEGFAYYNVEQTDCCDQAISARSIGTTLFGGSFNIFEEEVARSTPSPNCENGGIPGRLQLFLNVDGNFGPTNPNSDLDRYIPGSSLGGNSVSLPQEIEVVAAYLDENNHVASPPIGVSSVTFSMEDVSQFKGFAMNMGDETGPDMTLAGATTVKFGLDSTARIRLMVHDYGGFGTIKAMANQESAEMRVPKDADANFLPDMGWKTKEGQQVGANISQAHVDTDGPVTSGDPPYGRRGDGFSAYAEYRGFIANGVHTRTSPDRKDYFILPRNQSQGAMSSSDFQSVGMGSIGQIGLTARRIRTNEIELASPGTRFRRMTRNNQNMGSVEPQFIPGHDTDAKHQVATLLQYKNTDSNPLLGGATPGTGSFGGPVTPNDTIFANVYVGNLMAMGNNYGNQAFRRGMFTYVAGHELGHSVHVCHRGNVSGARPGDCQDCGTRVPLAGNPQIPGFLRIMHTGNLIALAKPGSNQTRAVPNGYTSQSLNQVRLHKRGNTGNCVDP